MGQEVGIMYLSRWSELEEEAAKTPLCDIDIYRFRAPGTGRWSLTRKAELTFESFRGFHEFLNECHAVSNLCPPSLDEQLMILFAWKDLALEFDPPFFRRISCPGTCPWNQIEEGLFGAFNPQTVATWCEVARSFSWEECEPFFERARKDSWLSFKGFRAYGQSWIDHYEEACALNAGLVAYHWG